RDAAWERRQEKQKKLTDERIEEAKERGRLQALLEAEEKKGLELEAKVESFRAELQRVNGIYDNGAVLYAQLELRVAQKDAEIARLKTELGQLKEELEK
ncbi:unnamed protein product, partial [Effrenium voratum]